jgi:hypothetical protein
VTTPIVARNGFFSCATSHGYQFLIGIAWHRHPASICSGGGWIFGPPVIFHVTDAHFPSFWPPK